MKSKILILILIQLITFNLKPLTIFSQWVVQYDPSTCNIEDVSFINQNTGWACGQCGQIIKTTNSGVNWFLQTSGVYEILTGIHAVDSQYVYCVGWWETILKTTNGGNNWIVLRNMTTQSSSFFKTFFINRNKGWLLKTQYILRTSDGCNSFDSTYEVFSYMSDIYFKDNLNGVLCGDGALIMKSTDGGIIWNQIQIPLYNFSSPNLDRESFVGDNGWVVGYGADYNLGSLSLKTTNFGLTWDSISRVPYPNYAQNYSIYFSNLNTGWCGGSYGFIFKTTNGGLNWYQQQVPSQYYRADFWFYNDSIGWAVGGLGQILKTTTSGQWADVKKISEQIPSNFKLYQNFPNPFNPKTKIKFDLKQEDGSWNIEVRLVIYDILGREVANLIDEQLKPGTYEIEFDALNYSSGVYFYRLITEYYTETKKLILIK